MFIESLDLLSYRNYRELSLKFDQGTNLFYGDNAQGKTNLLEAIYLCGTTKSHRGSRDREIISFDQDESHIRMKIRGEGRFHRIDMHLRKNKSKGVAIDGLPIKKASELYGLISMVFFSPEDLGIIKNGPAGRRSFIDSELSQCSSIYMRDLISYHKILNQRNKLLKDIREKENLMDTLEIWDQQLVSCGRSLIRERKKFIRRINPVLEEIHFRLTGGKEKISLLYEADTEESLFEEKLFIARERDLKQQFTSVGPHRDDYPVFVNDMDLRKYGSQGQQRSAALSLKLSEIEILKQIRKEDPVLLLDDVLSELDGNRQNYLLKQIDQIQTFITCTGMEDFAKHSFLCKKVFHVKEGKIEQNC